MDNTLPPAKIKGKKPDIRFLNDMKEVLFDGKWAKKASNFELYYMYRGIKKKNGLRYDITIIPPRMLGKEFVKTKGHEHLGKFGEIYIVLEGEAIYLMQKRENEKIKDVYVVRAKKGDIVVIPPFYGHVTINPSKKTLKMANWVAEKCKSSYDLFEKKRGACYFAIAQKLKVKNKKLKIKWIKNKNYKNVPKLSFEKPLKRMPRNLDFLKN
ncbi:glucose-6-phosphate isomerase [bacterium]|nr:glucose-6-phosphate isomerase [bacterium]